MKFLTPVVLPADAVEDMEAVTKQQLDAAGGGGGGAGPVVIGPFHADDGTTILPGDGDAPPDGHALGIGTVVVMAWAVTTVEQTTPTAGDKLQLRITRDASPFQATVAAYYDLFDGLESGYPHIDRTSGQTLADLATGIQYGPVSGIITDPSHLEVVVENATGWEGDVYALVMVP